MYRLKKNTASNWIFLNPKIFLEENSAALLLKASMVLYVKSKWELFPGTVTWHVEGQNPSVTNKPTA